MPDDGSKMVQCSKCKTWYHQKCVRGDFSKREWLCPKCEFTETGDNPHGEHATIKDAFADYDDGQGSTSESPTLNTLISDAKQVSDHHYSAQGRKIGMSHTKDRSTKVKQSPRVSARTVKVTLGSDALASVNNGPTYSMSPT